MFGAVVSITPSAVSNTYSGYVTMQVSGITAGHSVLVQRFLDANTNGIIDAADICRQQFQLTDGTPGMVIAGITNVNVPGDTDATAGQITAQLNFASDNSQSIIGKYLFRVSSLSGDFSTPLTNSFAVTNTAYSQGFAGNVINSGTNVPNAVVLLLYPGGNLVGAAVANNSGAYAIQVPPGSYMLMASKSNYLANQFTAPVLTVTNGQTISTNLTVTNATQSISGKIVDAANSSVGFPGLLFPVSAQTNGWFTLAFTDTNGNFTVGTRPDLWKIQKNENDVGAYGYVVSQGSKKVDTSTGSVANVTISYPKATALFYGYVKDNLNHPLSRVDVSDGDNNGQYESDTKTDVNGYYTVGALCGATWDVHISGDGNQAFTNYVFSQSPFYQVNGTNLTCGQSAQVSFSAQPITGQITGWVHDGYGNALTNVQVSAEAIINGGDFRPQTYTDLNGNYSMAVANATWSVSICCGCNCGNGCLDSSYDCPGNQDVTVANNTRTAYFVASQIGTGQRPVLSQPARVGAGQVGMYLSGSVGYNYTLLVSDNVLLPMGSWTPILVTNLTTSPAFLLDTHATNAQHFYRAQLGP
jgi:Carboxypeptidase regulatory-like domain